jgi:hypothetical protein
MEKSIARRIIQINHQQMGERGKNNLLEPLSNKIRRESQKIYRLIFKLIFSKKMSKKNLYNIY